MITLAASIALAVFALFALLNFNLAIRGWQAAREDGALRSTVPLIGGSAGALGCFGFESLQPYAWAPFLLDPGCAAFLVFGLPKIARERWQFSAFNLLREYRSTGSAAKAGTLRLYKKGKFVLRLDFHRVENERGISQFSRSGTWQETAAGLKLTTRDGKSAELSKNDSSPPATLGVTTDFPTFQTDAELALAGLVFAAISDHA
jgi:hypothetical protein